MKEFLPFDHRPDAMIGDALRRALDPGDASVFVARVLGRAERIRQGVGASWDGVLASWARVGVAAAVTVALAAGYVLGRSAAAPAPRRASVADAVLAPATSTTDVEVVLASVIEN
ncbi:MAG TPA: hypothetical protein VH116_09310 [Gemmatimonadales bacterium]|nr:hypothetical protein [Gemmatimonadales bacterium]